MNRSVDERMNATLPGLALRHAVLWHTLGKLDDATAWTEGPRILEQLAEIEAQAVALEPRTVDDLQALTAIASTWSESDDVPAEIVAALVAAIDVAMALRRTP
jgi:hypothetical protein